MSSELSHQDGHRDNSGGIALAGIMGGLDSEIKDDTCEVVLEAANFDAGVIRRSGTRLGLRTESSARFEKVSIPILLRRPPFILRASIYPLRWTDRGLSAHGTIPNSQSYRSELPSTLDRRLG